jgi:hypothetical protein
MEYLSHRTLILAPSGKLISPAARVALVSARMSLAMAAASRQVPSFLLP